MDTEHTAKQLELAAAIIRTGHPWEYRDQHTTHQWRKEHRAEVCPIYRVANKWEIRLVLATPPDNRPLHNPSNLTAEQVGAGFRLGLKTESTSQPQEVWDCAEWKTALPAKAIFSDFGLTYRVPLSIPWPEVVKPEPREVDLGPEDVPPNSVFSFGARAIWIAPICVSADGVGFPEARACRSPIQKWSYALLREKCKINRPRHRDADGNPTLWEPCSKKVED